MVSPCHFSSPASSPDCRLDARLMLDSNRDFLLHVFCSSILVASTLPAHQPYVFRLLFNLSYMFLCSSLENCMLSLQGQHFPEHLILDQPKHLSAFLFRVK